MGERQALFCPKQRKDAALIAMREEKRERGETLNLLAVDDAGLRFYFIRTFPNDRALSLTEFFYDGRLLRRDPKTRRVRNARTDE